MPTQAKQATKRILSVKIKRMVDDSPDTSHLGEYADKPTGEFSIDRMHAEDCASQEANHADAVDKLERILSHLFAWRAENANNSGDGEYESLDAACDAVSAVQEEAQECDCGGHACSTREYRYFNPSFNYVGKDGKPSDGLTPDEVRKYTLQDYERMERLNAGDWCYIGISAEAEVRVSDDVVQRVTSGGLWGFESDMSDSDFAEVNSEQLADLKTQLAALGFSKRSISQAFKDVQDVSE